MSLVLTICHIIRPCKCEHCTLTYPNKITYISLIFAFIFLLIGGRWFSKILCNIWGSMSKYLLFLTGVGGWSGKGQKHPYVIYKWPLSYLFTTVNATSNHFHPIVPAYQNRCAHAGLPVTYN